MFPQQLHCLAETLEMHHLTGPEEFDDIVHIRIIGQSQDIVVGHPRLLLRCQILRQIRNRIALDLHTGRAPGESGGGGGIDPGGMIHKIGRKRRIPVLLILHISGQLVNDGPNHF